ncbi:hypothetical protein ABN763_02915 [Spongiivirga sp. MCCC 1A20706]|uniref:hypothetical protein n=1 Tax=Spongiivirga sp. MCCC 1A20706 TaxID=3160963 RepID=UPI003977C19A
MKELDLSPILTYLEKCHEGDLLSLTKSLDKSIFMFHFLAQDTFTDFERQNCCHVLMELKEAVMEIYLNIEKSI